VQFGLCHTSPHAVTSWKDNVEGVLILGRHAPLTIDNAKLGARCSGRANWSKR
jgi:hypothetical protein